MTHVIASKMGLDKRVSYDLPRWLIEKLEEGLHALNPKNFPARAVLVSTACLGANDYETMVFPVTLGIDNLGHYRKIHFGKPIDCVSRITETDALVMHEVFCERYVVS